MTMTPDDWRTSATDELFDAILLVRDLRLLISLRSDFPDDEHRDWILRRSAQDLLLFVSLFHDGDVVYL